MRYARYSATTLLGIVFVLALFSAAWCGDSQEIEAGTGAQSHIASAKKTLASGLDAPGSLVCDRRGNHYVAVYGSVLMLTPDGSTTVMAQDLPTPLVLSLAPDGGLYAAAPTEGSIYRISPNGACTREAHGLAQPMGIAVDRDGNCTVSLAGTGEVVRLLRPQARP